MLRIIYYVHATTTDNEQDINTGTLPGELSETGMRQAHELAEAVKNEYFDAVFSSDLKRAVDTAKVAFGGRCKVIEDERLRECNYGTHNGRKESELISGKESHVKYPFPGGESYTDVQVRIADFLRFLRQHYSGKRIAIIAHQAPQLALDVLVKGKTWDQAFREDWRKSKAYQHGWEYVLSDDRTFLPLRYTLISPALALADKPVGVSSFDVIRALRKELGVKKIGHAGTLDPLASGLMILGVGEGTKELERMLKMDKTYEGEILFGRRTATGDMEGEVLESIDLRRIDEEKVKEVIASLQGEIPLALPSYSAKKIDGKKLYELARQGQTPETLPMRTMVVRSSQFHELLPVLEGITAHVTFEVGSGTYVRSLAEESGRRMEIPSTLYNLRRTRVGPYTLSMIDQRPRETLITYSKVKAER